MCSASVHDSRDLVMVYGLRGLPGAGTGFISSASTKICWENVEKLADRRPVAGRGGVTRARPPRNAARRFPYNLEWLCSAAPTTLYGFVRELEGCLRGMRARGFVALNRSARTGDGSESGPDCALEKLPGQPRVAPLGRRVFLEDARPLRSRASAVVASSSPDAARSGAIFAAECGENEAAGRVRCHARQFQHPLFLGQPR